MLNLFFILLLRLIVIGIALFYGQIGLSPDEAQYWTWSQALDFGYYSKPPAIAWQIALGTSLFGDTEFGVRFGALLIGFLLPIAVYILAKACRLTSSMACWAGAIFALSPLGITASFLATTDGGMVLAWTIATALFVSNRSYLAIGFVIAMGALFKWTIFLLWPLLLLFWFWKPEARRSTVMLGILISLLGLLPSLYWNYFNDWATFKHVATQAKGGQTSGNLLEFIGAQAALFSPILFFTYLWGLFNWKKGNQALKFCAFSSFSILCAYSILAIFTKIQGNWGIFIYPAVAVYTVWAAWEKKWLLILGTALSIALTIFTFLIPTLHSHSFGNIPYKWSPFRHNLGGNELLKLTEEKQFLFSDKYQTTSLLSFYNPEKKRAYFLNLQGTRQNQFDYWPGLSEEQLHKDGYFFLIENQKIDERIPEYLSLLKEYFSSVESLGIYPLFYANGLPVKWALIIHGKDYNGKKPAEVKKY